jgi:sugar lactone lactonase YvrE
MTVEILCDIACELGEGPSYDPHTDTLWWFDIANRKLVEKRLAADSVTFHSLPVMGSAIARVDAQRQLLATETGLYLRDTATGRLAPYKEIEAGNPETRSNDSRVHPCGAFWIGTMGKKAEKGAGAIYWHFKGEVRKLFSAITIPNAICFSPDGRVAWYADSRDNRMMRAECDPLTGLPVGEPKVFIDARKEKGSLDGSVCDRDGLIWNAKWGAGTLDAYSPQGKRVHSIAIPARQASCPAFIGVKADAIAVTSAWEGMTPERRANDPQAGFTFLVDGVIPGGFKGRFEPDAAI